MSRSCIQVDYERRSVYKKGADMRDYIEREGLACLQCSWCLQCSRLARCERSRALPSLFSLSGKLDL